MLGRRFVLSAFHEIAGYHAFEIANVEILLLSAAALALAAVLLLFCYVALLLLSRKARF